MFDEQLSDLWLQRYGKLPNHNIPDVSAHLRHRSVRRFHDTPVDESVISGLIACAQGAATSSNVQSWSVVTVQDPVKRERIAELCANQHHVLHAPWFLVFCADLHRGEVAAARNGLKPDSLDTVEAFLVSVIDCALAAERFVCAAESLGLGTCYIGALRNQAEGVADLLGFPERVFGLFGLSLGYPSEEDKRAIIKPRLAQEGVWFREGYREVDTEEFDARMEEFYPKLGATNDQTWSYRQGQRFNREYFTGREHLMAYLQQRGLNRR